MTVPVGTKMYMKDTTCKVTGKSGEFYRVYFLRNGNYQHGWVHKSLVEKEYESQLSAGLNKLLS